jgi:YVTN family beta-propeller protein
MRHLLASAAIAILLVSPLAAREIYVSNEKGNTITIIDGITLERIDDIPVGNRPRGIALSPDGKYLYICASDDDTIQVGTSSGFPWTAYLLVEAPGYDAVRGICNIIRETPVGEAQLWKYYTIEARLGRPLFFGEDG